MIAQEQAAEIARAEARAAKAEGASENGDKPFSWNDYTVADAKDDYSSNGDHSKDDYSKDEHSKDNESETGSYANGDSQMYVGGGGGGCGHIYFSFGMMHVLILF